MARLTVAGRVREYHSHPTLDVEFLIRRARLNSMYRYIIVVTIKKHLHDGRRDAIFVDSMPIPCI
jgi:hypothetical protein